MEVNLKNIIENNNIIVCAPAGCGKTETIVDILANMDIDGKYLILTHTNAGVSSIKNRILKKRINSNRYNVQTIASYCSTYVNAFPKLSKVNDINNYNEVYKGMLNVIKNNNIKNIIRNTYIGILVDEYQDCNIIQHEIIKEMSKTIPCKIFGDYLQSIFDFPNQDESIVEWSQVEKDFNYIGNLEYPWRWEKHSKELGNWIMQTRKKIENNMEIDFTNLPTCVEYIKNDNKGNNLYWKCMNLINRNQDENKVVLFEFPNQAHNFSRRLGGKYTSQEEIECKDLIEICKKIKDLDNKNIILETFEFAKKCFTNIGNEYSNIINILKFGKKSNIKKNKEMLEKINEIVTEFSYIKYYKFINEIEKNENNKLFRRELWFEYKRVIKEIINNPEKDIIKLAIDIRNYKSKKYEYKNMVSRILLVKGLEFNTVIVVNPENLNKKLFYVAISRPTDKLIIVSNEKKIKF